MKKSIFVVAALAMSMMVGAQSQTLMTINGKPVSAEEFLYIYEKNNQAGAVDPKTMDEYLDMFINFKLKVAEAEAQGIDTTESFKSELKGYRAQATPKYMQDEAAMDSLIEMSWRHMAKDRRAAHIAIQCPMNADDSTQAAALEKINNAYQFLMKGSELIATHPDDLCPTEDGYDVDIGPFIMMFEYLTKKKATVIGKPNRLLLDMASSQMGIGADEIARVGDRLYTDMRMAWDNGIPSILVLTGETTIEDLKESDISPTYVFDSVADIIPRVFSQ